MDNYTFPRTAYLWGVFIAAGVVCGIVTIAQPVFGGLLLWVWFGIAGILVLRGAIRWLGRQWRGQ